LPATHPGAFQLTIFHLARKNNLKISVVPATFLVEARSTHVLQCREYAPESPGFEITHNNLLYQSAVINKNFKEQHQPGINQI
jgi:hypothetical protein